MPKKYKYVYPARDRSYHRYDFQFQGRRITSKKSERFLTPEAASMAAQRHRARLIAEYQAAGRIGTTFLGISEKFLDHLCSEESPIKKDGIINKGKAAADFLGFMKNPDLELHEISANDIEAFLNTRPNNDSFNRYRTSLNQIFEFAIYDLKIIEYNPVKKIRKKKVKNRQRRICPKYQEVLLLIQAADNDFPAKTSRSKYKHIRCDERDLLLIVLHSMARYGEIIKLKWADVDFKAGILTKRTYKAEDQIEKEIPVPINKDLYIILQRRWEERQQDEWVFWNHITQKPYDRRAKLMKKLRKKAGIKRKIDFHGLRHFITTKLSNDPSLPLPSVQELLGHTDIKTTQGYMHPVDSSHWHTVRTLEGEFDIEVMQQKQLLESDQDIIDGDYEEID